MSLVLRSVPFLLVLDLLGGCASMGTPRVIYLARHGQTEWNRLGRFQGDPDLDQVGYVNRVSLWMLLRDRPLDTIYTSEARRTRRTAELLAIQHRLAIQPRAALNEISAGVMTGICYALLAGEAARPADRSCLVPSRGSRPEVTMRTLLQELGGARRLRAADRLPLGENYHDLVVRTAPFLEELRRGARDREVLIVAHGVVNRVLLHHLLGWPLETVDSLRQENDQVYRIQSDEQGVVTAVDLFTPGYGWRACRVPPRPGQKELDCNPGPVAAPPSSHPLRQSESVNPET
jgi:broad specificity phosphatase PhoE